MHSERGAGAVVLLASDQVADQLQQVIDSGWSGPVVLVSSVDEARALVGAPQHQDLAPRLDAPAVVPPVRTAGPPRAAAERHDPATGAPARLRLVLDPDRQVAVCEGKEQHLTPLEFGFLQALLVRPGRVCHFADLTQQVWGTRHLGDVTQVHSLVKRVRRKLHAIGSPVQIQAIRGVGFRAVVRRTTGQDRPGAATTAPRPTGPAAQE